VAKIGEEGAIGAGWRFEEKTAHRHAGLGIVRRDGGGQADPEGRPGGEVGAGGSARATDIPPLGGTCPTGLLYGRIQSGKTVAMIISTVTES
jgi:hypothetical protein